MAVIAWKRYLGYYASHGDALGDRVQALPQRNPKWRARVTGSEHYSAAFVDSFPTPMEPGIIYVSTTYSTAGHTCACGCGNEVVTKLSPAKVADHLRRPDLALTLGGGHRAALQLPLLHHPRRSRLAPETHTHRKCAGTRGRPPFHGGTPRHHTSELDQAAMAKDVRLSRKVSLPRTKVEADSAHKRRDEANIATEVKRQRSRNETICSYGITLSTAEPATLGCS